jgi:DNA replication protein DnaC
MKTMTVIKCKTCGNEFESKWSIYCSVPCAESAYRESCIRESWDACRIDGLQKYKTPLSFHTEQNPSAWAFADEWQRECNVYAWGGEGIGKTSLCKYLLTKEVDRCKIVEAPRMTYIQAIAKKYDNEKYIAAFTQCDTLLLDDIHDVCLKSEGYSVLRAIIDDRHESGRRTLVTANKSPQDMTLQINDICGQGFGTQLMRRLAPIKELTMTGKSYRQHMQTEMRK